MGLGPILNRIDSSYNNALSVVRGEGAELPGFSNLEKIPPPPGNQVRQSTIANGRDASAVRNMVKWFLPEAGIVEMYINPKNIKYNYKKHIGAPTRTRGGFLLQYWGEELGTISINGTTGSSGVEGINVLEDIYRSEQVAMDALALASEAARDRDSITNGLLGNTLGSNTMNQLLGNNLFDQINNIVETGSINPDLPKPTLASLAFQTEMYWSGWVFRGYFNTFDVTEGADNTGLFDYNIQYTVTQKRGLRLNFMPWHRSAVNGPSNSDPAFGTPYSFGALRSPIPQPQIEQQAISRLRRVARTVDEALQSFRPI